MSADVQIKLKPAAWKIFRDPARFRVVVSGRRFGKTMLAVTEMAVAACGKPRALVWFVAPTIDDARGTAFRPLLEILDERMIAESTRNPMYIKLINGSEIEFLSAEKSKRGRGLDLVVLDEFAFFDKGKDVWEAQLRPALSDKLGRALFTTTPSGYNWAYDVYMQGAGDDPEWSSHSYTTLDGGWVLDSEIEAARRSMDPRLFRQEYEASFEALTGRVYSNFDRHHNVSSEIKDDGGVLLVGMDFNVNPMSAVVAQQAVDECHVLDAIEVPTSNTEEMAEELKRRYPDRHIIVCPDPSGRSRKTSAPVGETDFTILKRHGFKIHAPTAAPPVVDRINNTQAMLLDAMGRRRTLVHPRCTRLIRGLDGLTYKEDTNIPDKSLGLDHITDALGYLLWQEFNVLVSNRVRGEVFRVV